MKHFTEKIVGDKSYIRRNQYISIYIYLLYYIQKSYFNMNSGHFLNFPSFEAVHNTFYLVFSHYMEKIIRG